MKCDKCGSEHTQRLEVLYEQGLSNTQSKSRGIGVGVAGGGIGIGAMGMKSDSSSISVFAQKAAPPNKASYKIQIIMLVLSYFILAGNPMFQIWFFIGLGLLITGAVLTIGAFRYNSRIYPELMRKWRDTWVCNQCGHKFLR